MKSSTAYKRILPLLKYVFALGVIAAAHYGELSLDYYFDDTHGIVGNPAVRKAEYFPQYFTDPYLFSIDYNIAMYRPITLTSYLLNYLSFGYIPFYWHLVNLALHLAAALLVMLFAKRLFNNDAVAIAAGLIFGCHPLTIETSAYISARSGELAAIFAIAALYVAGAKNLKTPLRLIFGAALFALSVLSKENTAVLPAMALLFAFVANEKSERKSWLYASAVWFSMLGFYMAMRNYGMAIKTVGDDEKRPIFGHLITQASVAVDYLRLILLPYGQSLVYGIKRVESVFEIPCRGMVPPIAAFIIIGAICFAAFRMRKSNPVFFTGIFWFFIALLPETLITLNQVATDRRLYFPMVGAIFAAVSLALPIISSAGKKIKIGVPLLIIIFMIALTVRRDRVWETNYELWLDATKKSPYTSATWSNLGKHYLDSGQMDRAINAFMIVYEIEPDNPVLINNMGAAMEKSNKLEEAAKLFQLLTVKFPTYSRGWYNYGSAQYRLGKKDEAERAFKELLRLVPQDPAGRVMLGVVYQEKGLLKEAVAEYRKALETDPEMPEAKKNLRIALKKLEEVEK